ncbi:MAG: RebB family R body protein [Pseudomonadota bacterium]
MSKPEAVNSQITDATAQGNLKVVGEAPAIAVANLYEATSQAMSVAAQNMAAAQQRSAISAQAATNQGVIQIYGTAVTGLEPPHNEAPCAPAGKGAKT